MQSILQHLFNKKALRDISVEEIEQCIRQYPYFPLGHFLLTKKRQPDNDAAYQDQLQKTAVYFHNPLWMQYQLQKDLEDQPEEVTARDIKKPLNGSHNNDVPVSDLIEEVVLHQEAVYQMPEDNAPARTTIEQGFTHPGNAWDLTEASAEITEEEVEDPPMMNSEASFPLQAYHTVDYFASQGIKISHEIQPDDKLGKQLKSFTEWLKTMRRLPEPAEEVAETGNDKEVEQLAAHSLEENEVITEAMAEVLVKQGKHQRAREIYHKLSLLNPHKIAYFAAKIDALNLH